jgi:hypothetical protein
VHDWLLNCHPYNVSGLDEYVREFVFWVSRGSRWLSQFCFYCYCFYVILGPALAVSGESLEALLNLDFRKRSDFLGNFSN